MTKIIKSLDKNTTEAQIESGTHVINFCSWERLKPYIIEANGGSDVKGVRVTKEGLEIIIKS